MLSTRDPSQNKRLPQNETKRMGENIPCKWRQKKAGVPILLSDKVGFKTKTITRDKEVHYIILEGSVLQEDVTLINIYKPNIGAPKHVKKILVDYKEELNSNTGIVGDFNTPLSPLDRSRRQ